jgi:hypothetical protein
MVLSDSIFLSSFKGAVLGVLCDSRGANQLPVLQGCLQLSLQGLAVAGCCNRLHWLSES